jgi:hypothetical protein
MRFCTTREQVTDHDPGLGSTSILRRDRGEAATWAVDRVMTSAPRGTAGRIA